MHETGLNILPVKIEIQVHIECQTLDTRLQVNSVPDKWTVRAKRKRGHNSSLHMLTLQLKQP